jgi:hypothetical protein
LSLQFDLAKIALFLKIIHPQMKELAMGFTGLLGVVIGSWLSPWLSNRLENSKTKNKLKPEVIRSLYVFCNYRKLAITLRNEFGYNGLVIRMMQADNFKPEFPEDKRKNNHENIALLREMNRNSLETLKKVLHDLALEESNLLTRVSEVQQHYGQSTYAFVDNLIQPEIEKSNKQTDLFDYAASDYPTYQSEIAPTFRTRLDESKDQLDREFKRIAELVQVNL